MKPIKLTEPPANWSVKTDAKMYEKQSIDWI